MIEPDFDKATRLMRECAFPLIKDRIMEYNRLVGRYQQAVHDWSLCRRALTKPMKDIYPVMCINKAKAEQELAMMKQRLSSICSSYIIREPEHGFVSVDPWDDSIAEYRKRRYLSLPHKQWKTDADKLELELLRIRYEGVPL
jgi:hypothetical protein